MMNAKTATEATVALVYPTVGSRAELSLERANYRAAVENIINEFRNFVHDSYSDDFTKETQKRMWAKVWKEGAQWGFYDVESRYKEYANEVRENREFRDSLEGVH